MEPSEPEEHVQGDNGKLAEGERVEVQAGEKDPDEKTDKPLLDQVTETSLEAQQPADAKVSGTVFSLVALSYLAVLAIAVLCFAILFRLFGSA